MTVDEDEDSADDEDTVLLKQKIKASCQVAFGQCEGVWPRAAALTFRSASC